MPVGAGKLLIVPANRPHALCSSGGTIHWLHAACTLFGSFDVSEYLGLPYSLSGAVARECGRAMAQRFAIRSRGAHDYFFETRRRELAWRIFRCLLTANRGENLIRLPLEKIQRLRPCLDHIRQNGARPIRNQELAKLVGVSVPRLFVLFSESVGVSPQEYILRERLQTAQSLLLGTTHTIVQVAEAAGFADPSYFCRVFRQRCGISARTWRQRTKMLGSPSPVTGGAS